MTAPGSAGGSVPHLGDRLAARAVALAIDPAVTPQVLAATLTRMAGESRPALENALRRVSQRDPDGRSQPNTRAADALRLALTYHDEDLKRLGRQRA